MFEGKKHYCIMLYIGRSVHEPGEEGESLLSLACSAGYYELAEVLLRMRAGVEDRGLKGDISHAIIITHNITGKVCNFVVIYGAYVIMAYF